LVLGVSAAGVVGWAYRRIGTAEPHGAGRAAEGVGRFGSARVDDGGGVLHRFIGTIDEHVDGRNVGVISGDDELGELSARSDIWPGGLEGVEEIRVGAGGAGEVEGHGDGLTRVCLP
jgi:hypothetical protein